jgi:PhnB protein
MAAGARRQSSGKTPEVKDMGDQRAWPAVVPMPTYEDVGGASAWLCKAFGFEERDRFHNGDGTVTTAILDVPGGGVVMLGRTGPNYQSPRRHREECEAARLWQDEVPYVMDGVLVTVADVDAHCAAARTAGAVILTEPTDTGHGRMYRVEDVEGHRWMFQH